MKTKICPECKHEIREINDDAWIICPECGYDLVPKSCYNICVNRDEVKFLLERHRIDKQIMPFIDMLLAQSKNNKNN